MTAFNPDSSSCYSCCDNRTVTSPIASYVVDNIAALRAMSAALVQEYELARTLGYYSVGDGGGNMFYWSPTSVEVDNGGTIIAPTGISVGRWIAL
jgi:hypothetical protein